MEKDVIKLEKIQRKAVRFIKKDYRSKTTGSLTNMQEELKLPVLKHRRKEKRLCFLYNIQKGAVQAINKNDYLKPIQNKRQIRAKIYSDCVSQNIVSRHQNLHDKCYQLPTPFSIAYKNSFFQRPSQNGLSYHHLLCLLKVWTFLRTAYTNTYSSQVT